MFTAWKEKENEYQKQIKNIKCLMEFLCRKLQVSNKLDSGLGYRL